MDAASGDRESAGTGWGARLGVLGLAALLGPCGPLLPGPARALEAIDIFQARTMPEAAAPRSGPASWTLGAAFDSARRKKSAVRAEFSWPAGGGWRLSGTLLAYEKELSVSKESRGFRGRLLFRILPRGAREGQLRFEFPLFGRR